MKTYVFIIRRICTISGAVQYIYNKTKYLESHGWRVLVFSSMHGPVLVKELNKFSQYIYPSLYYSPSYYRKKVFDNTINGIIKDIGSIKDGECIIESDALPRAVWAEIVASHLRCRHLVFFIREKHEYNKEMKKFLLFKYNRHELAGITKLSVAQMLGDNNIESREDSHIRPYCNNVFEDCEDNYSELLDRDADYTIGSLGRLIKPCVPAIVEGIFTYVHSHPNLRFNIVMIGGAETQDKVKLVEDKIRKILGKCSNVNLIITGNVYPVPMSLINKIDVFVSTAGAAGATYHAGLPTVTVNPLTGEPVGVIGLDFQTGEKTMYDSMKDTTIAECIDKAICYRDKIIFKGGLGEGYRTKMNAEFERQLLFVNQVTSNDYYDIKLLLQIKEKTLYGILRSCLLHLLGIKKYDLICRYLRGRMV